MCFLLHGLPPRWGEVLPLVLGLHGDDGPSMPSDDDGPLRQGAREGLDWFSVAMEASGGGTPDLGFFLEVWVYI